MPALLRRAKFATIVLLALSITGSIGLATGMAAAHELSDAAASIRQLETDLDLLEQKNDSIDTRMEALTTTTVTGSTEMHNSLFSWSNPSIWYVWIVLLMAIVLLFFMRRGTMIVTIGPKPKPEQGIQVREASVQQMTHPLAEPLKIVKIKVRKISKLNKSHAPKKDTYIEK